MLNKQIRSNAKEGDIMAAIVPADVAWVLTSTALVMLMVQL